MTRERKWILIIGVVLLLLGAVIRFMPAGGWAVNTDPVSEKILAKYRAKAAERDALQERLLEVERALGQAEASLLSGGTRALAAVDIQNQLSAISENIGITPERMRVLSAIKTDGNAYDRIPVQVALQCNADQLRDLLYSLETSDTLLTVTALQVQRSTGGASDHSLQIQVTVEGLMKPAETNGEKP